MKKVKYYHRSGRLQCNACGDTYNECQEKLSCILAKAQANHIDENGSLWTSLPQVGGYASPCRVTRGDHDGHRWNGFNVDVYHDGDFPQDEAVISLHFCSPEQIIEFVKIVQDYLKDDEIIDMREPCVPKR